MTQITDQIIHVRFDGRSEEVTRAQLNLGSNASDAQIKHGIASHFDLPRNYFDAYVIVRTNHAIILRPEAIYG